MKVIQVGIGGMGNAWLRAVQDSAEVAYAGFVEVNEAVAAEQVAKYGLAGLPVFKSLDEALHQVQADGVINVTPPQFHKAVSLTALEAGVPVLSEKPLADTRQAALEIVATAERTGVLHMVTQNYRYKPPIQTLKKALIEGGMGPVGAVHIDFFKGPHFGGFREEMAYPLIIDMSIHHFDLMRFFLDSDPLSVFGRSWNPPWSWFQGDASASVMLDFANGVQVSYNGSWCSQGRETGWNANWRFECANGVVAMVDDQVYTQGTGTEPQQVEMALPERTDQVYLLHEFYEAVTTGKPPVTTCQDNIKSLGIVFDVVASFESGQVVRSA
jgi:predicted dehydrogenase